MLCLQKFDWRVFDFPYARRLAAVVHLLMPGRKIGLPRVDNGRVLDGSQRLVSRPAL
jgi:hypothetical protein